MAAEQPSPIVPSLCVSSVEAPPTWPDEDGTKGGKQQAFVPPRSFLSDLVQKNMARILAFHGLMPAPSQAPVVPSTALPSTSSVQPEQEKAAPCQAKRVKVVSKLSESEASIVEQARAGNTSLLIEHVYGLLRPHALRQVRAYREVYNLYIDIEDVIQIGALQMVKDCKKALRAENPISLLRHAAHFAMIKYCKEARSPIRVPYSTQWEHKGDVAFAPSFVLSLDELIFEEVTRVERVAGEAVLI
jgi:hypothetical protein